MFKRRLITCALNRKSTPVGPLCLSVGSRIAHLVAGVRTGALLVEDSSAGASATALGSPLVKSAIDAMGLRVPPELSSILLCPPDQDPARSTSNKVTPLVRRGRTATRYQSGGASRTLLHCGLARSDAIFFFCWPIVLARVFHVASRRFRGRLRSSQNASIPQLSSAGTRFGGSVVSTLPTLLTLPQYASTFASRRDGCGIFPYGVSSI